MQTIHDQVQEIARRIFQAPQLAVTDETTADDVEKWDSLTHITFIVEVEKHFKTKFRNAEIARLRNIGDLKKLVASKLGRAAA